MRLQKILLFIFLICLISCSEQTGNLIRSEPSEQDFFIETYFCPREECMERILTLIDSSTEIKCAFFELNLKEMIDALEEKSAEVVIEDQYALPGFYSGYSAALMHNKFCVFDNSIVLTGSMNPTERGNYYNNNNIVIVKSRYLAENYLSEFEELKENEYGKGARVKHPVIYLNGSRLRSVLHRCLEVNRTQIDRAHA